MSTAPHSSPAPVVPTTATQTDPDDHNLSPHIQLHPEKTQLKDMTREELGVYLAEIGEKPFRTEQIFNWMYVRLAESFGDMTNLPKKLRARLERDTSLHRIRPYQRFASPDGASKLTFKCHDGAVIESVWIPNEDRNTLCVSSQVGCAMGCDFCLTAKMGLLRNLSVGEIVEQIVHTRRAFDPEEHGRLTNIVMMGMGEPLHNYDNLIKALRLMIHDKGLGLSNRKVTVSTSGLVPAIEKLGKDININLAISLNATTNEIRDAIMPINKRWPIEVLMETLRAYPLRPRRRITFEYVLLGELNDSLDDAKRLMKIVHGIPSKINLIPWNPHPGGPFKRPSRERMLRFKEYLRTRHVNVTIRETRGLESMAACGQLGKPGDRMPKRFRKQLEASQSAS